MKFAIRVDASRLIGTGHVMRCLALADSLAALGADCHFLCRALEGNLIDYIRRKGHAVHTLQNAPAEKSGVGWKNELNNYNSTAYGHWLGCAQEDDATACLRILSNLHPDWLIVDHYALDACWEQAVAPFVQQLMVIDDLADRPHSCDLLLDQNLGRSAQEYESLIPSRASVLVGPKFALLRPEFAMRRQESLSNRQSGRLSRLLISMGGVDYKNVSGTLLEALESSSLAGGFHITIVMGRSSPWLDRLQSLAARSSLQVDVLGDVGDMALLMANSDLAIGAAGTSAWERCCLGLPTLITVLADNQIAGAKALCSIKAARLIKIDETLSSQLSDTIMDLEKPNSLTAMSNMALSITDGKGVDRLVGALTIGRH
ncbi:UDP-2,4-diacetamido-2,4,6-trideoxy-beta-L-altropyranose hydrolase [Seongchinamella sediminis]|uniref:UDP-2,4-diacetamido-2,4, 6-trideoxy-beta-L-altropyranose hydrolase n=1 Tax=Seongchinamella sediminis TaxID=2283635 RepID=A0A3L7DXC6_9GAMM|nr:UDP-2,4-diacetamido-2,4,6-trideoxy-beta-L-altropyranose hydrolase [Seongchinamella sediminis]RLQ22218.1 UDP-2,4-diacetamido-2,4,6-trideoxy-beta-L-altropyranose hydrolase [Seongchinamella sediminis]